MKPFVNSEKCKSGDVCFACRLLGEAGNKWRSNLVNFGYSIDEVMFSCPQGKEWHANKCRTCGDE